MLRIDEFINDHRYHIVSKLLEIDKNVSSQKQGDGVFVTQSMPLVSAIINIGSTTEDYKQTLEYIKETWGEEAELDDSSAISILSGLVFLYLVTHENERISKEIENSAPKDRENLNKEKQRWSGVYKRVEVLFDEKIYSQ